MTDVIVLIKPDGVARLLSPAIRAAFQKGGFRSRAEEVARFMPGPDLEARFGRHYSEHTGKEFYQDLVRAMSYQNMIEVYHFRHPEEGMIPAARDICARIRDLLGHDFRNNTVHVSDSLEAAEREYGIWFEDAPSGDD